MEETRPLLGSTSGKDKVSGYFWLCILVSCLRVRLLARLLVTDDGGEHPRSEQDTVCYLPGLGSLAIPLGNPAWR